MTPSLGYELVSLIYNDGTADYAVIEENGVYGFEMPEADVTVKAVFSKIAYAVNADGGFAHGTVAADVSSAGIGDLVTLTVEPEAGYLLVPGSLTYGYDGEVYAITATDGVYGFIMPAADVTIAAEFAYDTAGVMIGDVDDEGDVDIVDAVTLFQAITLDTLGDFDARTFVAADTNKDDGIGIQDVILLLQYDVRLITQF